MREFLKGLELDKETIDTIMAEHGKLLQGLREQVEDLKDTNKKNEDKIKELEKVDVEKLKKEQFDLGKAEGEKEFETFKKSNALEKALGNFKAKDIKLLQKLIDNDKLTYEEKDGAFSVNGLDSQIEEIKKNHDYLFNNEEPKQDRMTTGIENNSSNQQPKVEPVRVNSIFKTY